MDTVMKIKFKPYKGRYCSRRQANIIRDFFESLPIPNDAALRKEAEDFEREALSFRRQSSTNS